MRRVTICSRVRARLPEIATRDCVSASGWGDILKEKQLKELDTFVDDYKSWHIRNIEKRKVGKASPSKPGDGPHIIGRTSSAINLGRGGEDQAAQEAAALHRDFGIG